MLRQHRRAAQGDPAAARLGRRQARRRQQAGRRGNEEHRPRRQEARRRASSTASPARASGTCSTRFPPVPGKMIDAGFKLLAERWNPILDVFDECGVQVRPGSASRPRSPSTSTPPSGPSRRSTAARSSASTSIPATCIWQGVDPVEFIRAFPDRIYHVHVKDAIVTLNGKTRHPRQPPQLRRPAPRLGLPQPGPRPRELRGDHPRPQRSQLRRPALGRMGRQRHGPRARRPRGLRLRAAARTSPPAAGRSTRRLRRRNYTLMRGAAGNALSLAGTKPGPGVSRRRAFAMKRGRVELTKFAPNLPRFPRNRSQTCPPETVQP